MASALLRLLALVAVLLMPAGMGAAPAMAQPAPAAAGHCDEHREPADEPAKAQMHCMACSALPAIEAPPVAAVLLPKAPRLLVRSFLAAGITPELPTPPPKLA